MSSGTFPIQDRDNIEQSHFVFVFRSKCKCMIGSAAPAALLLPPPLYFLPTTQRAFYELQSRLWVGFEFLWKRRNGESVAIQFQRMSSGDDDGIQ